MATMTQSADGAKPAALRSVELHKGFHPPVLKEQPQCVLVLPLAENSVLKTSIGCADAQEGDAAEFMNKLLLAAAQFVTQCLYIVLLVGGGEERESSGRATAEILTLLRHIYCSKAVAGFAEPASLQDETGSSSIRHFPLSVQILLPCSTLSFEGSPVLAPETLTVLLPHQHASLARENSELHAMLAKVDESRRAAGCPPLAVHYFDLQENTVEGGEGKKMGVKVASRHYSGVVVGGTFDRLHAGHKLLLSSALAVLTPGGSLVVGLATGPLLDRKVLAELVQSYERRSAAVEAFLRAAAGPHGRDLNLSIVPVAEVAPDRGATDGALLCIVVSQETKGGAAALNAARAKNGLPALEVLTIPTVDFSSEAGLKQLSSTQLRLASLGTLLSRPEGQQELRRKRSSVSCIPFVLGLTGGIASGKSTVRDMLIALGAEGLDADSLGHRSYVPGTPTFHQIVEAFGPSIVSPSGEIDRRALGSIVFSDKSKMENLTGMVWPAIGRLVEEELTWMAQRGVRVCVAEAAVLLEAGWERQTDEVWVVFVSRAIAKQRLMARNHLSESEADKRLNSQMSVEERIARADVLISNAGERDETQKQVGRAWELWMQRFEDGRSRSSAPGGPEAKPAHPLWARWVALMERLGVADDVTVHWWDIVRVKYSTPERRYHTLDHIEAMFALYHEYAHFITNAEAVHLAIFFHDVVYDAKAAEKGFSERESAELFRRFADHAGDSALPSTLVGTVEEYILRTIDHLEGEVPTADLAWFLDLDLAILGSEEDEYACYSAKIREEYNHIEEGAYCKKRAEILQRMLDSPRLFRTPTLHSKLHAAAQRNLGAEIPRLLHSR